MQERPSRHLLTGVATEVLYMYAVSPLVNFYSSFGFVPIRERDLPATIRERYAWAMGDMDAADVCPMKRVPPAASQKPGDREDSRKRSLPG